MPPWPSTVQHGRKSLHKSSSGHWLSSHCPGLASTLGLPPSCLPHGLGDDQCPRIDCASSAAVPRSWSEPGQQPVAENMWASVKYCIPTVSSALIEKKLVSFLPSRQKIISLRPTFFFSLTSGKHYNSLPADFLDLKYQLKHLCMKNQKP